eukprot:Rhum_TRINITY_DN15086_c6_g4::Rhum_TRINITY_DN15086_c6_g4_i1::g.137604::m.137604
MRRAAAVLLSAACVHSACVKDAPWAKAGACPADPCEPITSESACHDKEVTVEGCPSPPPDPDYCFVQPCAWKDGKCAVRACLAKSESTCTGDCVWRTEGKTVPAGPVTTLVEFCKYDPCHGLDDSFSCSRNSACHFDFNTYTCTVGGCAAHTDDATCGADAKCQWDAHAPWDQPQCKEGPCANKAKSSCNADSKCMFKGSNCVPKTCDKYNVPTPDMCACGRDTDCKWHHDATHPHCNDP